MTDPVLIAIPAALVVDALIGDPRWLPHPVRALGAVIGALDRRFPRTYGAGFVLVSLVLLATAIVSGLLVLISREHPHAEVAVATLLAATALCGRDLAQHAERVARPLESGDLPAARAAVGMIVGRDTAELGVAGVSRAATESVAESTLDGVIAPLFWLAIGGPIAMWLHKAASTMDSMIGHRTERHERLGWAAARLDDALAFVPARLAPPLIALAALPASGRPFATLRCAWRDGGRHPSPNAGRPEAAYAGALGLRLGGRSTRAGVVDERPVLNAQGREAEAADVRRAIRLLSWTTALAGLGATALRLLLW